MPKDANSKMNAKLTANIAENKSFAETNNKEANREEKIIIVGAGWAGLACALELITNQQRNNKNYKITILEAGSYAGGRARGIAAKHASAKTTVDNGQHLLIGAYTATLDLLKTINVNFKETLLRLPLQLVIEKLDSAPTDNNKENPTRDTAKFINLKLLKLPNPWGLLFGLITAKGITIVNKFKLGKSFAKLSKIGFQFETDTNLLQALQDLGQSNALIYNFWEPIAKAALSTSIEVASANVFFKVVKDSFFTERYASDWIFTKVDLSTLFVNPAIKYLREHSVEFKSHTRVTALHFENDYISGIDTNRGPLTATKVILATPPTVTAKLLATAAAKPSIENFICDSNVSLENETNLSAKITPTTSNQQFQQLLTNLEQFTFEKITTIYFFVNEKIQLPYPMLGLTNGPGQWLFDRGSICSQENKYTLPCLSVIITGDPVEQSKDELLSKTFDQLKKLFPSLSFWVEKKVICEKAAAFSCTPQLNKLRPTNLTPIPNLFLAGDYTQTGYPATLEGAVRSGIQAAKLVGGSN